MSRPNVAMRSDIYHTIRNATYGEYFNPISEPKLDLEPAPTPSFNDYMKLKMSDIVAGFSDPPRRVRVKKSAKKPRAKEN